MIYGEMMAVGFGKREPHRKKKSSGESLCQTIHTVVRIKGLLEALTAS